MFSKAMIKLLVEHFKTPIRYRNFPEHAEGIIGVKNYSAVRDLIDNLKNEGIINSYTLTAKNKKTITLYTSRSLDEVNPYELAMAMFPNGYFCNLSAIYYHALTNQIPKSIYICNETISAKKRTKADTLTNNKLRNAFIKPPRYTSYTFERNGYEIVVVDRTKNSGNGILAVHTHRTFLPHNSHITCIERALIDAIVSPQYNGGIVSVYSYFKNARKKLNIRKFVDIYRYLNFVYPYSQSIGFFLERLGMQKYAAIIFKSFPPEHKFYVDHNAKTFWKYDDKWKVYYPDGLVDEN